MAEHKFPPGKAGGRGKHYMVLAYIIRYFDDLLLCFILQLADRILIIRKRSFLSSESAPNVGILGKKITRYADN